MARWKVVLTTVVVSLLHVAAIPRTIWEYDENLFALAVEHYQPLSHHPPPPGYPLYIAFAKVFALFMTPFAALVATSLIATIAGFIIWTRVFDELGGKGHAAILLYCSPALLVSGTLAMSDAGALALFGLAALACARRNPYAMALACAATIGWRQQLAVAIVPMFLVALLLNVKSWRERILSVLTFGAACFAWLSAIVIAAGGPRPYWKWFFGQASYYAAHDADLSRSGQTLGQIALHFVAHPWGPKWLSLPLLLLAVIGAFLLRKNLRLLPLAAGCLIYLAFAVITMDPADAVRYAIPALPLLALLAGSIPRVAPVLVVYAIGSFWYAWPVLHARRTSIAPPVAAANWIRANVPKNALIIYDVALRPHADNLLREYKSSAFDAGAPLDGPVFLYADGLPPSPGGVAFAWPDTDALRKLTRQHYGVVSVTPSHVERRFHVIEGVFGRERAREAGSWRWLGKRATIVLPDLGAHRVRITLRAPPEYPLGENRVEIDIHGQRTSLSVQRGASTTVELPIPQGPVRVVFLPEKTFVPAEVPGANNRDRRTLSVMLTRVEQLRVR